MSYPPPPTPEDEPGRMALWGPCQACGAARDVRATGSAGVPGEPGSGGVHDELYCPACGRSADDAAEEFGDCPNDQWCDVHKVFGLHENWRPASQDDLDGLVMFLDACLAEETERCQPLADRLGEHGWASEDDAWDEMGPSGVYEWEIWQAARRALGEIAIKRALLNEIKRDFADDPADATAWWRACVLTTVYSDRPGYRQEWSPGEMP